MATTKTTLQGKHLFFCCYGGGHVNMLIPLIKRAQKAGCKTTVLGLTTASKALKNAGIESIGYHDLLQLFPNSDDVIALGHELTQGNSHPDIAQKESDAYHGLNYQELIDTYGADKAKTYYTEKQRAAFYPINTLKRVLQTMSPDLVIATNSPRSERASIDAASELGIPAICIVDLHAPSEREWIKANSFGSKVCVLHEQIKEEFVALGRHRDDIVVTGNPAFDALLEPRDTTVIDALRKKHHINPAHQVILWASQPEPEHYTFTGERGDPNLPREVEQHLFTLIKQHPTLHLIIRNHPSEQVSYTGLPERVSLSSRDEALADVLHLSDIVLTFSSTVGLEADILNKTVYRLMMSVHSKRSILAYFNIGAPLNTLDAIADIAQAPKTRSQKPEASLATDNIMSVISELL